MSLKEIDETLALMEQRLKGDGCNVRSAACRLSLEMAKELREHLTEALSREEKRESVVYTSVRASAFVAALEFQIRNEPDVLLAAEKAYTTAEEAVGAFEYAESIKER